MSLTKKPETENNWLAMAGQQLLDYSQAKKGFSLIMLVESMGLTKNEWVTLKETKSIGYISDSDIDEIGTYMKS